MWCLFDPSLSGWCKMDGHSTDFGKECACVYFNFPVRDQASNWLERLPAGSVFTWEDLTTRFLAQFFLSGRTRKLREDCDMMFIEIIKKNDDSHKEVPEVGENTGVGELDVEYFDVFLTRSERAYHKCVMCGLIPSIFLRNLIIIEIMKRKLDPKENINKGVNNFTSKIKGMHVFVGNFTYIIDFIIVEDISSIIDPMLSQVVLRRLFVEISNMTHNPPEGVVRFTNGTDDIAYKIPHKIKQYNSLSDLEREHTKLVYLRNEEDKRRGVEYAIGIADEGEVT
uniref:Retrotransposon Orf1 n=1 Tax=Tanacetum cinerariifolium TaxID=118510 RepID=A0A6L2P1C7_TANCI|nr:retrotransposon Orf1 [Tanacetum cinerariifolium]